MNDIAMHPNCLWGKWRSPWCAPSVTRYAMSDDNTSSYLYGLTIEQEAEAERLGLTQAEKQELLDAIIVLSGYKVDGWSGISLGGPGRHP